MAAEKRERSSSESGWMDEVGGGVALDALELFV
jgi:hypothetical protein